MKTLSY